MSTLLYERVKVGDLGPEALWGMEGYICGEAGDDFQVVLDEPDEPMWFRYSQLEYLDP